MQKDYKIYSLDGKFIEEIDVIPDNFTGFFETYSGSKHWQLDGKYHRLDSPAIEYSDGRKYWYVDGKLHRIDGPAVEYLNGTKRWWIDSKDTGCEIDEEFKLLVDIMKLKGLL